ncbi:MAG: transporter substrate-binding domain-containing protein [Methylobacteriaceae bacterium]|nr:transporter substrate-binding domain-containing protein [Methylobacteriaceae bacterium]MBV9633586.1 transporter substrate-binding domain-containing protein [Methylobacteriaceae bacterium]
MDKAHAAKPRGYWEVTMNRRSFVIGGGVAVMAIAFLGVSLAVAGPADLPAAGVSKKIDAIKKRGVLRVAAIGEFPWLPENTTGSGPQYSGPAWVLAEEYAKRLGVKLEVVPVSHETKVPILATGEADISIAPLSITPKRLEVANFIVYSKSSLCFFGLADNPKLKGLTSVDELDRPDITMAYFTGTPPETWAPTRFKKMHLKGVAGSGANAPVEEVLSKRADLASIDNSAWPQLSKKVPGLTVFPPGDECLRSNEMPTDVGMAVDKADTAFRDWLQAVYQEVKERAEAEEMRVLKSAE